MKTSIKIFLLIISCFCLFVVVPAQNPAPRGITPEDYFSFEFISDPNISPDGKLVAYVLTKVDRAQNRRNSSIWMVATDGSRAPWQFTTSPAIFHFAALESGWKVAGVSFFATGINSGARAGSRRSFSRNCGAATRAGLRAFNERR